MAFPVTIDPWWISTVLTEHPNTPPAVPAYGSYGHWIVVNGAATSENPAPEPHVNPWYTPDFTVYGLWLTDPASGGIGQDLYVTAQSAQDTYLLPLVSSDQHNGYYLQVAEPPEETSDGQVDMAEPVVNEETIKVIEIAREMAKEEEAQLSSFEKRINSAKRHIYDAALVVNLENDANNCKENALLANSADDLLASVFKFGEKPPIELNWKDVVDPSLLTDEDFRGAFDGSQAREFVKVRRADMADSYYYLIPFDKYVDGRFLTYAAVIVDAADGSFKEASWVEEPTRFIQVNKDEAIRLAESLDPLMHGAAIESELIWEPGSVSQSPFYPYWLLTSGDSAYYVTQEGGVISK